MAGFNNKASLDKINIEVGDTLQSKKRSEFIKRSKRH